MKMGEVCVFLKVLFITNDPQIAAIAQDCGVDRIMVDMETLGKEERQKGMNTVKSHHTVEDVRRLFPVLSHSELMVRINPWHDGSAAEIEAVLEAGAKRIMLPMWKSPAEVKAFLDAVHGRAGTTLLLETPEAQRCVDEVLGLEGLDEIHVGLNDLHLAYGKTFMFELVSDGTVERLCEKFRRRGIPYGFGGIARIGEGMLSADRIVTEHYRLGSTRAILSRAFCNVAEIGDLQEIERIFRENMKNLRSFEEGLPRLNQIALTINRIELCRGVDAVVEKIKKKREES
jgi:2-keto-3-deoxy-L-rhamnonate aldolase RhmA